jgi:RNA polymerase sigma-70 factor (ECF subfamily)
LNEELQLIKQAQKGDTSAMSELLQQNYAFLLKYLIKITLQSELAEDLAQDTMLKAMVRIKLYNGSSKFSSWLITIATRLYIDLQRKKKREIAYQEHEESFRKLQWQLLQQDTALSLDMLHALSQLTDELRLLIILKHYYGYTYDEISRMLDIPSGTVKSRIHHGLKTLRKDLIEHEPLPVI